MPQYFGWELRERGIRWKWADQAKSPFRGCCAGRGPLAAGPACPTLRTRVLDVPDPRVGRCGPACSPLAWAGVEWVGCLVVVRGRSPTGLVFEVVGAIGA